MSTSSTRKRLRFDHTETGRDENGRAVVRVTLTLADQVFQGESSEEQDGTGPLKAAAGATLKAVQKAAADRFTCSIADLDHVKALGKDLIAVLVDFTFDGRDVQVFGSCQIAGDEIDCAVKAALNATNRMFELAMRE